jgi:pyruvate dehydrogenase E2 component (dihydrolipoamide acetyltransferase)
MKASPLARRLANEKGVDLSKVMGSGNDSGRIVKRDIDWFKPGMSVQSAGMHFQMPSQKKVTMRVAVSQMRKTIAKRLAESKFTAPHFYLTIEDRHGQCYLSERKHQCRNRFKSFIQRFC